jgi:hypothetical protein
MMTIKIEINNVPTDRIDITNTTNAGVIFPETICNYTIDHHDFLEHTHAGKMICQHQRKDGRIDLAKQAFSQLLANRKEAPNE